MLIVLAALDAKRPGPVATRDIERLLEQGCDEPVYGPNLRASCRRMEATGWLRMLRASNLQLAVELTDAGRELAAPLLADEQTRVLAGQRATEVRVLPLVPVKMANDAVCLADDKAVQLDDIWHMACRGDYVIRLDGSTCLQLWSAAGRMIRLDGDPLQVAHWLQACHEADISIRMLINESTTPEDGRVSGSERADQTNIWYRQLEASLQTMGITGMTEDIWQAVVRPGESHLALPPPARLLNVLRESEVAFPLTASTFEEDTGATLDTLLNKAGFTAEEAFTLRKIILIG